jgi:hypothetical protein
MTLRQLSSTGAILAMALVAGSCSDSATSPSRSETAALGFNSAGLSDVRLSEIRIDQPSTDNDEYFELTGPASTSLDGLTYLVIGDGTTGSGTIEAVVDLRRISQRRSTSRTATT